MLLIRCPDDFPSERRYVVSWIFGEVFGLEHRLEPGDVGDWSISVEATDGELRIDDGFFRGCRGDWLSSDSVPEGPLRVIEPGAGGGVEEFLEKRGLPVIFGEPCGNGTWLGGDGRDHYCGVDLIGGVFFLISRYEEAVSPERDQHERFPASRSILGREGFLDRPIGNEYIEFLWQLMARVWPDLKRRKREFRVLPSHDIDRPSLYWGSSVVRIVKEAGKLVWREHNPGAALRTMVGPLVGANRRRAGDPFDNVGWIMDQSDRLGLKSAFYYIPECTDRQYDPGMPLDHRQVEEQWRDIANRGHEIGVHPGYRSCDRAELLARAVQMVRHRLDHLGIGQDQLGGRQHYLRWKTPETARHLDAAGMNYDSTLGFAEQIGFRCGVCYEFPVYDVVERKTLDLRERPLVVMDCSVMDSPYMGLGTGSEALAAIASIKDECRKYQGDFTILWHNTRFTSGTERDLYLDVLAV